MCQICADYEMKKLTLAEAYKNLQEVYDEEDGHSVEVWLKLLQDDINEYTGGD